MLTHFKGFVYGVDASSMFVQAMALLQKGLIAVGAFLVVIGIVNNHQYQGRWARCPQCYLGNCRWGYGRCCWSLCDSDYHLGGITMI